MKTHGVDLIKNYIYTHDICQKMTMSTTKCYENTRSTFNKKIYLYLRFMSITIGANIEIKKNVAGLLS